MSNVTRLAAHSRAPILVTVHYSDAAGWLVVSYPDLGYRPSFSENYEAAISFAAEFCDQIGARPDPDCPHSADVWIAINHLRPGVDHG